MDCKTKEMTSYQRLKWELEETRKALNEERRTRELYQHTLIKIAGLKYPAIADAPDEALKAIQQAYEKK